MVHVALQITILLIKPIKKNWKGNLMNCSVMYLML